MPEHLEQHELGNGLRVVLHEDRRLPLAAVNVWYHVGSKNEETGRTGLAHLFEHMLFQGSANVSENGHFEHVQKVGGVANGSTWYDRTNYYETLPANHLELGLWLESDRLGFLLDALTEEKFENQRSVVMNERLQRVNNQPYGLAGERLSELLYRRPDGNGSSVRLAGHRLHGRPRGRRPRRRTGLLPHLVPAEQRGPHPGRRHRPRSGPRTGRALLRRPARRDPAAAARRRTGGRDRPPRRLAGSPRGLDRAAPHLLRLVPRRLRQRRLVRRRAAGGRSSRRAG